MARPRIELSSQVEAEIAARIARGESAEFIHAATGKVTSLRTIARRVSDGKNLKKSHAKKSKTKTKIAPDAQIEEVPDNIPENTPVEFIQGWIARVEKGALKAEKDGNLGALSSLAMRAASLAEALRRATPLPKPDPNENPDMIALAEQGEELIAKTIAGLFSS